MIKHDVQSSIPPQVRPDGSVPYNPTKKATLLAEYLNQQQSLEDTFPSPITLL